MRGSSRRIRKFVFFTVFAVIVAGFFTIFIACGAVRIKLFLWMFIFLVVR